MADIQLTGDFATQYLNRVINALSDSSLTTVMEFTGRAVGVAAEGYVSEYPAVSGKPLPKYYDRVDSKGNSYKSKFKTLRQQRKVMAMASKGKIPSRRTGKLGQSITSDVTDLAPTSVTVRVGTRLSYAPYVIGTPAEGQSHYHQGNWTPLSDDIANHSAEINAVAQAAFSKAIRNAIKNG